MNKLHKALAILLLFIFLSTYFIVPVALITHKGCVSEYCRPCAVISKIGEGLHYGGAVIVVAAVILLAAFYIVPPAVGQNIFFSPVKLKVKMNN
ncbi:MAG: hypothetical protein FWF77_08175 [Defluviitaleaceae bacterium]|nr:hypothetical protein [Defluviitaleaceae bacterium]